MLPVGLFKEVSLKENLGNANFFNKYLRTPRVRQYFLKFFFSILDSLLYIANSVPFENVHLVSRPQSNIEIALRQTIFSRLL